MTLLELRDEIARMITAHPEAAQLQVYANSTDAHAADGLELERVILHDPDGDGFEYATVEPP